MAKATYLFITLLFAVGTQIASSVPQYSEPNYPYSSPEYTSSGSYSPGYYGGPGSAYSPYHSSPYNNIDAVFQQFSAQIQAQLQAFQRQIQQQVFAQQQDIWNQCNQVDNGFGGANKPASAFSSVNVGPQGGYQQGAISLTQSGSSRFGKNVAPPSDNNYGVFSSSSSSSSTGPTVRESGSFSGVGKDILLPSGNYTFNWTKLSSSTGPDGKTITRKSTTVGVNVNGKITVNTVHDP